MSQGDACCQVKLEQWWVHCDSRFLNRKDDNSSIGLFKWLEMYKVVVDGHCFGFRTWFAGQILVIEFHEINVGGYNSKNACLRKLEKETIYGNTH